MRDETKAALITWADYVRTRLADLDPGRRDTIDQHTDALIARLEEENFIPDCDDPDAGPRRSSKG